MIEPGRIPNSNSQSMMRVLQLILVMVSMIPIGYSQEPEIPLADSIDVDKDQVYDFIISYSSMSTTDIPPSHQSILGEIMPINNNSILKHQTRGILFLSKGDTIRQKDTKTTWWSAYATPVIAIGGKHDRWEDHWSILSDLKSPLLYLGIKLENKNGPLMGWVKIEWNQSDGTLRVVHAEVSHASELIIP